MPSNEYKWIIREEKVPHLDATNSSGKQQSLLWSRGIIILVLLFIIEPRAYCIWIKTRFAHLYGGGKCASHRRKKKKPPFRRHIDASHTEANTHTHNQLLNFVLDSFSVRLRMLFVCSITIYSRKRSLLLCPMTERKWECNLCQNDLFFVRNEMLKHRTSVIACGCWAISNVNRGKYEYPLITMRADRKNKIEKICG